MDELTQILDAIEAGDSKAEEELLPCAYRELRRIAQNLMARERAGHTLQPTALVHEAYLRLVGADGQSKRWESRGHFFTAASKAMRRILIESARRKQAIKRGGDVEHTPWSDSKIEFSVPSEEVLAVDEALKKLEEEDADLAQIVLLRYFAGLTVPETASALGVGTSTVDRKWRCAKAWLFQEISQSSPSLSS